MNHSTALRNALLDAFETAVGTFPILEFRSGAKPANAAAARTGTILATMTLPSDYMAAASGGTKTLLGTWQDPSADATGTLGYWTLYASNGTTVMTQGTVTATGGGGEITVDNISVVATQPFNITSFTITAGNA